MVVQFTVVSVAYQMTCTVIESRLVKTFVWLMQGVMGDGEGREALFGDEQTALWCETFSGTFSKFACAEKSLEQYVRKDCITFLTFFWGEEVGMRGVWILLTMICFLNRPAAIAPFPQLPALVTMPRPAVPVSCWTHPVAGVNKGYVLSDDALSRGKNLLRD